MGGPASTAGLSITCPGGEELALVEHYSRVKTLRIRHPSIFNRLIERSDTGPRSSARHLGSSSSAKVLHGDPHHTIRRHLNAILVSRRCCCIYSTQGAVRDDPVTGASG